jgi:hypothetical protein
MLGELKPKGPKGPDVGLMQSTKAPKHLKDLKGPKDLKIDILFCDPKGQGFFAEPFYGRARCSLISGAFKT